MSFPNSQTLQATCVVVFYMLSALIMVFVNKAVLIASPEIPLTFLLLQLLTALILLRASAAIWANKIRIPEVDIRVAKKLLPVVSVNIFGLVFNTLCLRDIEASFFQIARGLVLPFAIAVSSCYANSIPSKRVLSAASIVTFGFMVGVMPSSSLPLYAIPSSLSLLYGVLSSVFIAFHSVLIKNSLPICNNSTIELAWWTNGGSVVILLPFVLISGEPSQYGALSRGASWNWGVFLWGTLVTGLFGFLLCIAGLLSIKITSPITHMFSSAARSVLQTILAAYIFGDFLTINRAASISVILAGTMFYTWIKSLEMPPSNHVSKSELDVEMATATHGEPSNSHSRPDALASIDEQDGE